MGIQQSAERLPPFCEGVFPFLELPAEIRNQIYGYLLSTRYTKVERVSSPKVNQKPFSVADVSELNHIVLQEKIIREDPFLQSRSRYRYNFHTAITKVNRRIRGETDHVLRKENLFVCVTSYSKVLDSYEDALKPIVLAQHREAREFKYCAMAIHLKARANLVSKEKSFPTLGFKTTFIVACDDLQLLCRLLLHMDEKRPDAPILRCGSLRISLENLGEERMTDQGAESASHTASVRRLLEPLRFLCGMGDIRIRGDASESYKQDVTKPVARMPLSPEALVDATNSADQEGDAAFRNGEFAVAISTYQKGLDTFYEGYYYYEHKLKSEILTGYFLGFEARDALYDIHSSLKKKTGAAELRLEIEQVARKGADFARQHPREDLNTDFLKEATHQYVMWYFAIQLAGKGAKEVYRDFTLPLAVVLELEPPGSPTKATLMDMKVQWSKFLRAGWTLWYESCESDSDEYQDVIVGAPQRY